MASPAPYRFSVLFDLDGTLLRQDSTLSDANIEAVSPRGSDALGWASYAGLNAGLLLRLVGEPAQLAGAGGRTLLLVSAGLQLLGGWAFVLNVWPRVKAK